MNEIIAKMIFSTNCSLLRMWTYAIISFLTLFILSSPVSISTNV